MPYTPTKPVANQQTMTTTSGNTPVSWRMFGAAGAVALEPSTWIAVSAVQWKTFLLRMQAAPHNGAVGAASVEIQVANELDPTLPNTQTKYVVAGTLNSGTPSLVLEPAWRYVRAELKVAGGAAVQVDFHGISV
jgi:hypothetical protein